MFDIENRLKERIEEVEIEITLLKEKEEKKEIGIYYTGKRHAKEEEIINIKQMISRINSGE